MFLRIVGYTLVLLIIFVTVHFVHGYRQGSINQTHFWNNRPLTREERIRLKIAFTVKVQGDPEALTRKGKWDIRFHIPLLGGWKNYVVLAPFMPERVWYVGWVFAGGGGQTLLPQTGAVRMLRGPDDIMFFALNEEGTQIPLRQIDSGNIWDKSKLAKVYAKLPLL